MFDKQLRRTFSILLAALIAASLIAIMAVKKPTGVANEHRLNFNSMHSYSGEQLASQPVFDSQMLDIGLDPRLDQSSMGFEAFDESNARKWIDCQRMGLGGFSTIENAYRYVVATTIGKVIGGSPLDVWNTNLRAVDDLFVNHFSNLSIEKNTRQSVLETVKSMNGDRRPKKIFDILRGENLQQELEIVNGRTTRNRDFKRGRLFLEEDALLFNGNADNPANGDRHLGVERLPIQIKGE